MTKHRTTKHRKANTQKRQNIERLNIEKKHRKKIEITSKKFRNTENFISIHFTTTKLFRYRKHISGILRYEGISKSFEPNMERARNLDLFCFIFQRSPLPTPHTCPI